MNIRADVPHGDAVQWPQVRPQQTDVASRPISDSGTAEREGEADSSPVTTLINAELEKDHVTVRLSRDDATTDGWPLSLANEDIGVYGGESVFPMDVPFAAFNSTSQKRLLSDNKFQRLLTAESRPAEQPIKRFGVMRIDGTTFLHKSSVKRAIKNHNKTLMLLRCVRF
jgi:hypothetical protein